MLTVNTLNFFISALHIFEEWNKFHQANVCLWFLPAFCI